MTDAAERIYEELLVARSQAGDDAAFTELVGRYQARIAYFVRRLLGSDEHLDDVLQETWLAAFRGMRTLRHPAALAVWLYRIARNQACQQIRRRREEPELAEDVAGPAHAEDEPPFSPDQAALIHQCLGQLGHRHREVLVLRFLENMPYEEIANVVGCPVGTIRSRLYHAKWALRREMEAGDDR
ncbi:MAG: sigma-70 family RNA polymerase sigma factor [Planctomycetota bacterium]|nr:sigma-70 family RNA polymerase sigma factor [Planctomycetota bacterium]